MFLKKEMCVWLENRKIFLNFILFKYPELHILSIILNYRYMQFDSIIVPNSIKARICYVYRNNYEFEWISTYAIAKSLKT